MSRVSPLRIGVLVSGGGRSLQNLIDRAADGSLPIEIRQVIASAAGVQAIERAARHGIPAEVIARRSFASAAAFGAAIWSALAQRDVELAVLAGFLVRLPLIDAWRGRAINIHPALLPAFGGRGYYGHHVHDAVLQAGVKVTGCTVHFVDDEYDHGPIILQRTVPVTFEDTAEMIAERVFAAELEALPEAIRLFAAGRLQQAGGRVRILP